jgi:hypothetical protein
VEMALGMMNMKWGILNHPIGCSVKNLKWLIQAIGCLHNYCINERLAREVDDNRYDPTRDPNIPRYVPTVPSDSNGDPIDLGELFKGTSDGHSHLREHMAGRVAAAHLERRGNNGRKRVAEEEEE